MEPSFSCNQLFTIFVKGAGFLQPDHDSIIRLQFNCCVEGVQPEVTPAQVSRKNRPVVAVDAGSRLIAAERNVM
jgi:hypothetical protein